MPRARPLIPLLQLTLVPKTYYLVSTDDHMIPPSVKRMMATRAKATIVEGLDRLNSGLWIS
jgi:hypothetical protein